MKTLKYLSALGLVFLLSSFHKVQADSPTEIDGNITASSLTVTGPVTMSSIAVVNTLTMSSGSAVNFTASSLAISSMSVSGNITSSGTFTGGITISTSGIAGVTNGSSGCTGCVGESVYSVMTNISVPASGTWGDLTFITLTPGDWDMTLMVANHASGAVNTANGLLAGGIATSSGTVTTGLAYGDNYLQQAPATTNNDSSLSVSNYRVSLTTTTTYYGKVLLIYTSGSLTFDGRLSARRVR